MQSIQKNKVENFDANEPGVDVIVSNIIKKNILMVIFGYALYSVNLIFLIHSYRFIINDVYSGKVVLLVLLCEQLLVSL